MRRRRLPCALALLAAAVAAPPVSVHAQEGTFAPFSWAEVDFTPACAPNAAFERLMALVLPSPPGKAGAADPAIDEPVYNAVTGALSHVLLLDREIPWQGLRLVGVRHHQGIESGPSNLSLIFADGPERVRAAWNARGWNLPPAGQIRVIDDAATRVAIGIEIDGARSAVTCFID